LNSLTCEAINLLSERHHERGKWQAALQGVELKEPRDMTLLTPELQKDAWKAWADAVNQNPHG
jgi:hypothetical protein